jgi:tripartite ATP-independent transporter DctM subunit
MPVGLALMSIRFAWRAGSWPGRAVAFATVGACFALSLAEAHAEALVWPGMAVIAIGVLLGAPVFIAMAGAAMLLFFAEGTPIAAVPVETFRLVTNPTLPAVPLFTAAGYILAEGGASKRLVRLFRALVGWLPGGMALVVCLVCAAFTAVTGGSGVTILAVGGLMLPMLREEGYPDGFSLGLVTSSGSLGLLFPPSIPVILYAFYAKASESELYIAGFLPCVLLIALVAVYAVVTGIRYKTPRTPFSPKEALAAAWGAKLECAIPLVILLSIKTGMATLVEAAAISVILAVASQVVVFRDLHPRRDVPRVLEHASTLVGAVVILLGIATGFTGYLVDADVPTIVLEWTRAHIHSPTVFLLTLNGVLLVTYVPGMTSGVLKWMTAHPP